MLKLLVLFCLCILFYIQFCEIIKQLLVIFAFVNRNEKIGWYSTISG